jgi:hypothetical protein
MDEKQLSILRSEIEYQIEIIETIFDKIADRKHYIDEVRGLESLAYQLHNLHNLYSAFEDLFLIVAKHFENTIEDESRYHIELLQRMIIDIEGVRPPLLKRETMNWLDELRAFRHVFRHAYSYELDKRKLQLVIESAEKLNECYKDDTAKFLKRLKEG